MLKEVQELQDWAVTSLVNEIRLKPEVTFKAPTGSGKTHMMADFMDRVLNQDPDVIFIVSTLSKGELARQNYEKFEEYKRKGDFSHINPYLISSEISGEERLSIPLDYNVYVLPRDLYKKDSRLMEGGVMVNFLKTITQSKDLFSDGLNKEIYLIRDECHQATNNLSTLSSYFSKTINISATPKLSKKQSVDIEITESAAINAKLIKSVDWIDDPYNTKVQDAIDKLLTIQQQYYQNLGINPCLIIQISNKNTANADLQTIFNVLNQPNQPKYNNLKWMLIVDDKGKCDTNDNIKKQRLPVSKWKDYAKSNTSTIDIIIFKMVITEGWDIPRACMLYQMRNTQSKVLDEQVVGRVRRNPRLLDFEKLSVQDQNLALQSWVWGVKPTQGQKHINTWLYKNPTTITNDVRIKTTRLKPLTNKQGFNINSFMNGLPPKVTHKSIFDLYREFKKADTDVQKMSFDYAQNSPCQWLRFCENLSAIETENSKYICNYQQSMELTKDANGQVIDVSFPDNSNYIDNGNPRQISDWVWTNGQGNQFSFDSVAESLWADYLNLLVRKSSNQHPLQIGKITSVGTMNDHAGETCLDGSVETEQIDSKQIYLWGKNFITNSEIRFEYYMDGVHSSYPDFVLKDCFDRIHLFEVKSVNKANGMNLDDATYKTKIKHIEDCYKQASLLTGHIFYLPIYEGSTWQLTQFDNGNKQSMTQAQFEQFIKTPPTNTTQAQTQQSNIILPNVNAKQKFKIYLPVYPIQAACGYFDDCGKLLDSEAEGWVDVSGKINNVNADMFIVHAEGKSMEPKIKDGDLCVFNSNTSGSRQGKIVLVKAKDTNDPQAASFTIKKYSSEKSVDEDGNWKHSHITLSPLNPDFKPIEFTGDETTEDELKIYGELVQVL